MITVLLIFFPLAAAFTVLFFKKAEVKKVALLLSIIQFGIALYTLSQFQINAETQFEYDTKWIHTLGIRFHIGIDGISMLLVLLTTFLFPLIILSSFNRSYRNPKMYYALILSMQMALIGVFVAMDGFLFYVFWELALIPIYFLCLMWGGAGSGTITFKFFVYTLAGSLFMLGGLIYLFLHTANGSFDIVDLYEAGKNLSSGEQSIVFWCMFIAFAIKMPIFPFHTWQPDTYTTSPTQGTMLLSGIMLKMGTYGVLRWLLPLVPAGVNEWASFAILISVISIVYASCIAIIQKDFKRLIAYSSIAHVGLIAAGSFSMNAQGIQGALIQMLAHGVNVVGLFLIVEIIQKRTKTRDLSSLGGIRTVNPQFGLLFLIVLLGTVALPLTNGFVGEFLLLSGLFQHNATLAAFGGLSVILGAVYMLRSYQSIMLGPTNEKTADFAPLQPSDKIVLTVICAVIIVLGVYPKPLLDIASPAVNVLVDMLKAT